MSREDSFLTADMTKVFRHTALARQSLEEHFRDFEHQTETCRFGIWLFLATEIMFFGALFLSLGIYHYKYTEAFEMASQRLNWQIGGINTIVLLVSSLTMVLAVHYARLGDQKRLIRYLLLTAAIGAVFMVLKGLEYYLDYRENLIPGWRFEPGEWIRSGLTASQAPHVKLFLLLYFIMTLIHAVHLTVGITLVLILAWLAARGRFTSEYYGPIDVSGLYWHFVDVVWIFLLPMLYLLGTHKLSGG